MFPKTSPDHGSDDRANDRSGHEIREPMDGQGDTQADIKGVEDRHTTQPPWFRTEREHRHGHGESNGGMRRRPAPENAAAQKAEVEDMTEVVADNARWMGTTGKRLVGGRDKRTDKFRLADGPACQLDPGIFNNETGGEQV